MSIEFTFKSSIMKNRQTTILYVLLCCTCLFSCQRDNTTKLLELAEAQIWENPDSTLQILEQISSPEKLKGKEKADYALLLTQAKYRYNILAPSDSLINITIDYYKEKADSLLHAALKTSDLNVKVNIYSALYKQAEENKQYKKAIKYLKNYIAVIDSVRDELKSTEIRELQLKYDKSITLRQNAEIRMSWYLTIAIGILIVIVLILLYFYSLKMYKKQKGKELSQQKQGSIKLQEQIDTFQTMIEENENLHSLEQEEALNKIMALQNEKGEKDIRIKQLETMFRAKDITVSSADAEALQTFLKITELKKYIPAADRDKLQHWLNIVHQNFATRLNEQYSSLTGREKDICYLTALNLSLETVAQLLDVQPRSIERYTIRICEKFDFRKRSKESFIDFIIAFTHNK